MLSIIRVYNDPDWDSKDALAAADEAVTDLVSSWATDNGACCESIAVITPDGVFEKLNNTTTDRYWDFKLEEINTVEKINEYMTQHVYGKVTESIYTIEAALKERRPYNWTGLIKEQARRLTVFEPVRDQDIDIRKDSFGNIHQDDFLLGGVAAIDNTNVEKNDPDWYSKLVPFFVLYYVDDYEGVK